MYELWAKKRKIDGRGQQYKYITSFYDINEKYYMTDTLDASIYEESMVIKDNRLIFYKEYLIPQPVKKLERKIDKDEC